MSEIGSCPNCDTSLKSSVFGSVHLLNENDVRLINEVTGNRKSGYCNKCGRAMQIESFGKVRQEMIDLQSKLQKLIHFLPLSTIQSPINWDYEVLGLVTGQATTGTGIISEFTSSFTDLFGAQSGRYNKKLKASEQICAAQIRQQALNMGGNAIVGVDIDYSEVGGDKGMLMVCMAGTAVKINNTEVLKDKMHALEELSKLNERHSHLFALVAHENLN